MATVEAAQSLMVAMRLTEELIRSFLIMASEHTIRNAETTNKQCRTCFRHGNTWRQKHRLKKA
jgi:hypothetical protein